MTGLILPESLNKIKQTLHSVSFFAGSPRLFCFFIRFFFNLFLIASLFLLKNSELTDALLFKKTKDAEKDVADKLKIRIFS